MSRRTFVSFYIKKNQRDNDRISSFLSGSSSTKAKKELQHLLQQKYQRQEYLQQKHQRQGHHLKEEEEKLKWKLY